ncbi:skin secretory protein xP2-like [Corvus kubaryi]|uniref:skin secretory protein xP2-like n=1 Tax=Corvus kubaryi TaxID=68294 RepID=UPI001C04C312|nr:skin secretory protein xP2-like [Corvus kubaryi]
MRPGSAPRSQTNRWSGPDPITGAQREGPCPGWLPAPGCFSRLENTPEPAPDSANPRAAPNSREQGPGRALSAAPARCGAEPVRERVRAARRGARSMPLSPAGSKHESPESPPPEPERQPRAAGSSGEPSPGLREEPRLEPARGPGGPRSPKLAAPARMEEPAPGAIVVRIGIPDLQQTKCLRLNPDVPVWVSKQRILCTLNHSLKDVLNYGLFQPPFNGRAGKFLDEERLLREYPLNPDTPVPYLEVRPRGLPGAWACMVPPPRWHRPDATTVTPPPRCHLLNATTLMPP